MRYWLRLMAVLTALYAVAEDACPHWISVVPLKADDVEGIVDDVVAQGNETIINGIAWICTIHPAGNPVVDKAAQYAETYRKLSPRVRAKSAVKQGILLQATMGHGGFPGEATPWQLTVKPDGESVYRMCPLDPRFLDYIAKECRTFASPLQPHLPAIFKKRTRCDENFVAKISSQRSSICYNSHHECAKPILHQRLPRRRVFL